MNFLTAEWRKLAFFNYTIDPEILRPYVPPGTELDLFEGKCYVSLIGFMFLNTKILGVKFPFHVNFEEVNLRFYVKHKVDDQERRGVVFVKEIVPRKAIPLIANNFYGEHYEKSQMNHNWETRNGRLKVHYAWKSKNEWQDFSITAAEKTEHFKPGSKTEFITEHYWGYSKKDDTSSNEYQVKHPKWKIHSVENHEVNVDFEKVYGTHFAFLNQTKIDSVILVEGSETAIEIKSKIKS